MKMIALGAAPARPTAPHTEPANEPAVPSTLYAAVVARNAKGEPTHIALPRPLAGGKVGLYTRGGWVGDVMPDGTLKSDGTRGDLLRALKPGTRIVAIPDPSGRIMCLAAVTSAGGGGKARPQRSTEPERIATRSADSVDPYRHDPHEVLIAGAGGRVLDVR